MSYLQSCPGGSGLFDEFHMLAKATEFVKGDGAAAAVGVVEAAGDGPTVKIEVRQTRSLTRGLAGKASKLDFWTPIGNLRWPPQQCRSEPHLDREVTRETSFFSESLPHGPTLTFDAPQTVPS